MFDIIELNGKKVAELREIATKLGVDRADKLKKQDLVYSILDEQAAQAPSGAKAASNASAPKPTRAKSNASNNSKKDGESDAPGGFGKRRARLQGRTFRPRANRKK